MKFCRYLNIFPMIILIAVIFTLGGCGTSSENANNSPPTVNDTTPPAVASVSPQSSVSGVAINVSMITATFSEAMDAASISTSTFTVKDAFNQAVAGTVSYSGTTATFIPSQNLAYNTVYTAEVAASVKDAAGNAMGTANTWTFTTGNSTADTTPPTVTYTTPLANATGVTGNTTIVAAFSEPMDPATITGTTFTLKDSSNNPISGTVSYSGTTATFTPVSVLTNNTTYTATITTGAEDEAGNAIAGNHTWSFTTISSLTVTQVTTDINENTTWTSDKLYVVNSGVDVNAPLTIQPGTIVKFKAGVGLSVGANGIINANATATSPIIFTSYKDDSRGGDTNGDGSLTSPAPGNWDGIFLLSDDSLFNYCEFYYGGSGYSKGTLYLKDHIATVKNSTFAHNDGGTLATYTPGVLNAGDAIKGTIISGNIFYDNNIPMFINGTFSVDDSNIFHNPADNSIKNTFNGIFVHGDAAYGKFEGQITWAETEVPFVVKDMIIPVGSVLTLSDNVVLKFVSGHGNFITVRGTIIANASSGKRIVFTSLLDDTILGDTNGDGNITKPSMGAWPAIYLEADNSVFNNCEFYYGGGTYSGWAKVTIDLNEHSATITNCIFAHNNGGNDPLFATGVIAAGSASSGTVITGNTFYDNTIPLVVNGTFDIDDSNIFHNPADITQKNTFNGIFLGYQRDITTSLSWRETEVPFVIHSNMRTNVGKGFSLTLGDNVVIKFSGKLSGFSLFGSIVNSSATGVYFTSINDDVYGGDTLSDGTAKSPASGDWEGIIDCSSNSCTSWNNSSNILYYSH